MMMKKILLACSFVCAMMAVRSQSHRIIVHLDSSAKKPLSGRLYIFSVTDTLKGVQDPDPFNPTPTFRLDVRDWQAGDTRVVDASAAGYPASIAELKPGYYKFAAVLDIDTLERNNTVTPGNWYTRDVLAYIQPGSAGETHLYLSRQIPARPFRETGNIKALEFRSALVSSFRKHDAFIRAAVILPPSYASDALRKYPLVFIIPGWGGTHYDALSPRTAKRYGIGEGKEKIYVYLNPESSNPFGLHAFIDSRVNGPWGKALVEELVPYLSAQYRIDPNPGHHFVVGQSSGGYAALWLQLYYPKAFGGSWAVSPDPVDFSDFTSVNLYEKYANMYVDREGKDRPFFLMNGQYLGTIRRFAQFEDFLGDGGQMQSFEAAFGVPDPKTGKPQQLFHRETGIVNPAVVRTWKPYDLGAYLDAHFKKNAKDIDGKIHVYAGADDNFFLDRSVRAFKAKADKLPGKVKAELIPGANHWTIWTEAFTKRIQQEIDARIQ